MATVKKRKLTTAEITRERNRVLAVAQRAVEASSFLPVHGFVSDSEAFKLVIRIKRYLTKHKLILVDKSFKDYLVLFADARVHPKWRLLHGERVKK